MRALTSSLIDSMSLTNLGRSISFWGEREDDAVFFWRTMGDTRLGDTIRPRILGGVLGYGLRIGGDSPVEELRNESFFLITRGSMVLGAFCTLREMGLGAVSVFPVGSNGCLRLRGRGETDFGGVTGTRSRSRSVVSNTESRFS